MNKQHPSPLDSAAVGDIVAYRWRAPSGLSVVNVGRLLRKTDKGATIRHLQRNRTRPGGWIVKHDKWVDRFVPLADFVPVSSSDVVRFLELEAKYPPPETRQQIEAREGSR